MAVRIRLQRTGRRNAVNYKIGVFDGRTRRQGRAIEFLGHYDPRNKDEKQHFVVNNDRALHWLQTGALPSETVASIFKKCGVEYSSGSEREAKKRAKTKARRKARVAAKKA